MAPAELPSGTVTMLFTDIEGSTRLLQDLGRDAYVHELEEHRRLLRECAARRRGVEVEMQGDSFHFAFAEAADAVGAAVDGQRALARESPIRVRMGIHTGEPIVTERLYAGLDVHRAARVMNAAHGGQVLISAETWAQLEHAPPDGIGVLDLGTHRLKDLSEPQRLYQLLADDLTLEFPTPKTLGPNVALPVPPNRLIGRKRELAEIRALLTGDARLVTLVGPGGTGKTRLAVHAAAQAGDGFRDGIVFVPLAPLRDPALVVATAARRLSVAEQPGVPLVDTLAEALADKQLLLVLDNFEHVLAAAAALSQLLAAAPKVSLLVTSREPLRVTGEHVYDVPPLPISDAVGGAVALFVERARAVSRHFGLTDETLPDVIAVCARLDGLPLAVELAAARVNVLSTAALLRRLDQRFAVLASGPRDVDERQRTLRATVDWSYDLLDDGERRVFTRLAPFAGGARLDALAEVLGDDADLLDRVASLVDKSLVRRSDDADGEPRYWLLETIREYAGERLASDDPERDAARRHAMFFLALAEAADPELRGADQERWFGVLEREQDNLRAALAFMLDAGGDEALRLAAIASRLWFTRGSLSEGAAWLERAVALPGELPTRPRALRRLAILMLEQGDVDRAGTLAQRALELDRASRDLRGAAESAGLVADVAAQKGDMETAGRLYAEAAESARAFGDDVELAISLYNLANVRRVQGDRAASEELFWDALDVFRRTGDALGEGGVLVSLAGFAAERGDDARALTLVADGIRALRRVGFVSGLLDALETAARLSFETGDPERAAKLFGAFRARGEDVGRSGVHPAEVADHEATIAATRTALGNSAFEHAWHQGERMTLDDALDYVLEGVAVSNRSG